ncbi:MAG: hypothetical protein ACRCXK_08930 [Wohlfahrtiimonas sp.]
MSINCKDFLCSAEKCLEESKDEVDYRNAISRSYYSIYHRVEPLVSPPVNTKTKLSKQADLVEYLCDKDKTKNEAIDSDLLRTLGLMLENAKKRRVDADYKLGKKISLFTTELAIKEAHKFYEKLKDYE